MKAPSSRDTEKKWKTSNWQKEFFSVLAFWWVFLPIFIRLQDPVVCMMVEKELVTFQIKTKEYSQGQAVVQ